MIPIQTTGFASYHPEMSGDVLKVEKGWAHFTNTGTKDFLDYITAYQPEKGGISFEVSTFRGAKALVKVTFVSETAFRFQMLPNTVKPRLLNQVFDFAPVEGCTVEEEELFLTASTSRLKLTFRKCPWEMTVTLDGELLTMEQIKDQLQRFLAEVKYL